MDCIFCKIANKEISSYIIEENENHMAFLDIFPNTKGQVVIIPKKHLPSNFIQCDDKEFLKTLFFAKNISEKMIQKLNVKRVALVIEGTGIDHLHIKLYPINNEEKEFKDEKVIFENYPGYITTKLGPKANDEELQEILKKFIS